MIPIRDENPSGTFPVVTLALIATNVAVFLYELSLGADLTSFFREYGLVPANAWALVGFSAREGVGAALRTGAAFTVLSSMFLHGSILHIAGNMWFLWLFGDNIEDRLGHVVFALFYLVCGAGASAAHVFFTGYSGPDAIVPMVGASGAIAGVLGAYLVCFPGAKVLTIVPMFFLMFVRLPAAFFLVLWLVGQVAGVLSPEAGGIAWWAHIGGFVLGAVLVAILPKCKRSRQVGYRAVPDRWRARRY